MRKFLVLLAIASITVLSIPSASAHGAVVSTFPEQFANATPIPTQVWVEFDGNLQTLDGQTINTIEVVDSTGLAVSFGDPVIAGARITTKVSGQSAPGVFTVNYRIVSEDGHPVEGSYTFNASPEYAEAVPVLYTEVENKSSLNTGALAIVVVLTVLVIGLLVKLKNEKK